MPKSFVSENIKKSCSQKKHENTKITALCFKTKNSVF